MSDPDVDEARAWIERLGARPRPAGGEAEAVAREACRAHLAALGFSTRDVAFEYSNWLGRWGTPAGGAFYVLLVLVTGHLGAHGHNRLALAVFVVGLLGLLTAGRLAMRHGLPLRPNASGANLEATRGGEPAVWLVAHLDSKSQPVPILLRAATFGSMPFAASFFIVVLARHGDTIVAFTAITTGIMVVLALPVVFSTVGEDSPGALDNATGVATVLLAAARIDPATPVGVLLTSAEELGLAGARAWVRGRPKGIAINCDSIDERGYLTLMYSRRRPERLIRAFDGQAARVRPMLPGILTDSIAFADDGWQTITVSHAALASLARIHTRADTPAALTGVGVSSAAKAVAEAARTLTAQ